MKGGKQMSFSLEFGEKINENEKNNLIIDNTKLDKEEIDFEKCILNEKYLQAQWQMNFGEKITMLYLLDKMKPEISIEIGTQYGGSLKPISDYSRYVYAFDYFHDNVDKSSFSNVNFITGNSRITVPKIIKELNESKLNLEFVLIDGDHSSEGVKTDIENILKYEPQKPLYILIHDSFNPIVRSGILKAHWNTCPYIHFVDIDFLHGTVFKNSYQLWEGLTLALMLPEKRKSLLSISKSQETLFNLVNKFLNHN